MGIQFNLEDGFILELVEPNIVTLDDIILWTTEHGLKFTRDILFEECKLSNIGSSEDLIFGRDLVYQGKNGKYIYYAKFYDEDDENPHVEFRYEKKSPKILEEISKTDPMKGTVLKVYRTFQNRGLAGRFTNGRGEPINLDFRFRYWKGK